MKTLTLSLLIAASVYGQGPVLGSKVVGPVATATNATKLSGKPLCSASVTANCVPAKDASGNLSIVATVPDGAAVTGSANPLRSFTVIVGSDNAASALADADDQPWVFQAAVGAVHIRRVRCSSDAGTPTVNLSKNGTTDVLSAALECSAAGTSSATFTSGADALAAGDHLNFLSVTAGGVAKRVAVTVVYTVD